MLKFLIIGLFAFVLFIPSVVFAESKVYYDKTEPFAVEYPAKWQVDDWGITEGGVHFADGNEDGIMIGGAEIGIWNNDVGVWKIDDYGPKESDTLEKKWQLENAKRFCQESSFASDGFECSNFNMIKQYSGNTVNGYPYVTTEYTVVKHWADGGSEIAYASDTNIYINNVLWAIDSESLGENEFNENKSKIRDIINSFEVDAYETAIMYEEYIEASQKKDSEGGGCLIATATYGSELSPQVQQLRELRDNKLLQTESGQSFMNSFNEFYYSFSPYIADYERENPMFKEAVKVTLTPLLTSLSILNHVNLDSEESVLGYGISLIILNVGMYFVAPVMIVVGIRRMA